MEDKIENRPTKDSMLNQYCPRCGETPCERGDFSSWRWDGSRWQHYHGYPVGHLACVTIGEMVDELEKNAELFPYINTWDKWKILQVNKEDTNA